jgi:hypothetical protein
VIPPPAPAMAVEDPSLHFPELPPLEEPVGPVDFRFRVGICLTRQPGAGAAPFTVAGRRAFVAGTAAGGADRVVVNALPVARGPRLEGALALGLLVTPVGVERRLRVDEARVRERVVVPRDGPACLFEWQARHRPVTLRLGWTAGLGAGVPVRWRRSGRGLLLATPSGEPCVLFVLSVPPASLEVESDGSDGVRVRTVVEVDAGGTLRLAMIGGADAAALGPGLRSIARPRALGLARRGAAEQVLADRLTLDAPDPAPGQALDWAKLQLGSLLSQAPGGARSLLAGWAGDNHAFITRDATLAAGAALATGDTEPARDVLACLGRWQDPDGRVPERRRPDGSARSDPGSATVTYLSLAGEYLAWSGDAGFLQGQWPRLLQAAEAVRLRPGTAEVGARAAALEGLVPVAEVLGDAAAAAALRGAADAARAEGSASDPAGPSGASDPAGSREPALLPPASARSAAAIVRAVVGAMLGAEPDASRGRLALRPRPPAVWTGFAVRSLRVGEAAVALEYRRTGAVHRFRVLQEQGMAPLHLVLEPELPGSLEQARVDGRVAELAPRIVAGSTRVPVQLVLDHERVLELVMDAGPGLVPAPASP